jgi:hypothetical protein
VIHGSPLKGLCNYIIIQKIPEMVPGIRDCQGALAKSLFVNILRIIAIIGDVLYAACGVLFKGVFEFFEFLDLLVDFLVEF